jgi:hypothetical protein
MARRLLRSLRMKWCIALLAASGCNAAVKQGAAPDTGAACMFSDRVDFATGRNPTFIAASDFNGDGLPDVAILDFTSGDVSLHLNVSTLGATTPSFGSALELSASAVTPIMIAVGDLNGDGKPDLAIPDQSSARVEIMVNRTPSGSAGLQFYGEGARYTGEGPTAVALADFNSDGRLDLAVTNVGTGNGTDVVTVFLNTTLPNTGTDTPTFGSGFDFITGACPDAVTVADVNGDGVADLIVANRCVGSNSTDTQGSYTMSVLLGTTAAGSATPSFAPVTALQADEYPDAIAIGDFNADARPDIAVTNYGGTTSAYLNETEDTAATPAFAANEDVGSGALPLSLAVADLDGDNSPDIASVYEGGSAIAILRNTTPLNATVPSFQPCAELVTTSPVSVVATDFNGDGKPDLGVANGGADTFSVFLAQ